MPGPDRPQSDENLRVVEVRQPLCREALGQLALDDHILHLVAEQFVVDIARHGGLVHSEGLQRTLHPVTGEVTGWPQFTWAGGYQATTGRETHKELEAEGVAPVK